MKVYFFVQAYNVFGGDKTLSLIGTALEDHPLAKSELLNELHVTAHFPSKVGPRKTLETAYAKHHSDLARLPKVRWTEKKKKLELTYATSIGLAEEILQTYQLNLHVFTRAFREFVSVLESLEPVFRKKNGLNSAALLHWVRGAEQTAPQTEEALIQLKNLETQLRIKQSAELSPWEKLGLDWDLFHPTARDVLNDPFFWDTSNDYSPNGNDTGADLLNTLLENRSFYRKPLQFLDALLKSWQMKGMVEQALAKDFRSFSQEDEIALHVYNQASIALPFALIKIWGNCPKAVLHLGQDAISRTRSFSDWKSGQMGEEELAALGKIEAKLMDLLARKNSHSN